jgi:hypothetical protein
VVPKLLRRPSQPNANNRLLAKLSLDITSLGHSVGNLQTPTHRSSPSRNMDNERFEQHHGPQLHIIVDDDNYTRDGDGARSRSRDHSSRQEEMAQHGSSFYCCCFSPSPMPPCCLSALLNPQLGSPHELVPSVGASMPNMPNNPHYRRRRSHNDMISMDEIEQQEIVALAEAARITRTIGAAVIKRQAAAINRQLLQIQMQNRNSHHRDNNGSSSSSSRLPGSDCTDTGPLFDEEQGRVKRRKVVHSNDQDAHAATVASSPSSDDYVASDGCRGPEQNEEQARHDAIWYQVDRMKHMSMFLKNAQLAQSLFLQEMNDCLVERLTMQGNSF